MLEPARQLVDLLNGSKACILTGLTNRPVRRLTADSRQVVPGTLFVALRGVHTDGHHFLGEALDQRSEERRVGKECRSRWSPYH